MQRALCTDKDGKFDRVKFNKMINEDIPAHIDFPDEIEYIYMGKPGICQYEENEVKRVSQKQLQGKGKTKPSKGRYGDGRNKATFSTTCHPEVVGVGKTPEEAKKKYEEALAAKNKK